MLPALEHFYNQTESSADLLERSSLPIVVKLLHYKRTLYKITFKEAFHFYLEMPRVRVDMLFLYQSYYQIMGNGKSQEKRKEDDDDDCQKLTDTEPTGPGHMPLLPLGTWLF